MNKNNKQNDVVDFGGIPGNYHLIHIAEGRLAIVERIENGRPIVMRNQQYTQDFIRNTGRDEHTIKNMLKAEYARYGTTGTYPNWHANIMLVQTVDIVKFLFGSAPVVDPNTII